MATIPTQLVLSCLPHRPGLRPELSWRPKSRGSFFIRTFDILSLRHLTTSRGARVRTPRATSATASEQEEKDRALQTLVRGMDQVVLILEDLDAIMSKTKASTGYSVEDLKQAAGESVKKHLEQLDTDFLKALDFDITQARKAEDNMKCSLLELVKEEVLDQLTQQFPPQVRVVSLLVTVGKKDQRKEVLCRAAGGGGEVEMEGGGKLSVPEATFDMIREQLEDLIANLEEKSRVRERSLLAQVVVVREEVRELMAGGVEDPRNQLLKLTNIPNSHVEFMERVVALQGEALRQRLSVVFLGEMEGADPPEEEGGASDDVAMIETYYYAKELEGGIYKMQLIRRETLHVLRVLGFGGGDKDP